MPPALRSQPATEEQLSEFEASHGPIPEDYRWFLLACGGGHFGAEEVDDIVRLAKTHAKFQSESDLPNGWTMRGVFVIGWDGVGNPFGIEEVSGRVVLENHSLGGVHELALSLQDFMLRGIW